MTNSTITRSTEVATPFNKEHFERILAMAYGVDGTWDFSDNDKAALEWVCKRLDALNSALEAQPKAPPSVLTCVDEHGNVSGHEVTGCSGGADYVDGFPRLVMLQKLEGGEVVTYHHEATLPKAPASAVECAAKVREWLFKNSGLPVEKCFEAQDYLAPIIGQAVVQATTEAREKALEEAAQVESWYDGHGTIRYSHPSYNKTRSLAYSYGLLGEAIRALKGKEGLSHG